MRERKRGTEGGERGRETDVHKEQRGRETHIYTLVTRQTDSEGDKSRKRDGGIEDIRWRHQRDKQGRGEERTWREKKAEKKVKLVRSRKKRGRDLEGKLQEGRGALDLPGAGSADPGLGPYESQAAPEWAFS